MKKKTAIAALEVRAGELADSGNFLDWVEIAEALNAEGHLNAAARLRRMSALVDMLDQRCDQARKRRK